MASGRIKGIVLFGVNAVREALNNPALGVKEVFLKEGGLSGRLEEIDLEARKKNIPSRSVDVSMLERLTGGDNHQGVAARIGSWPYLGEKDLPEVLSGEEGIPFFVMLDHVQDVGNLGAIIRSAHLCGSTGVIIPQARAAPVTSAVVRASAGAVVFTRIFRVANLTAVIRKMKKAGIWCFGMEAGEGGDITETDLTVPLSLVLGSEEKGLSRLVKESCDLLFHLPMIGRIGSYNVSAAGSMAMYEIMRQRLSKKSRN